MIPLYDENPVKNRSYIRLLILIICTIVFFFQITSPQNQSIIYYFGFKPASLFYHLDLPTFNPLLTIFTSMFMHGGWVHFLGNMLYLWVFADNVEDNMGQKKFIYFYFLCGCFAAISQAIINLKSNIPMIGASGAIAGILGSYLYLYPKAKVLVLVPFIIFFTTKIQAYILLIFWFFLQFINLIITGNNSSVAWVAHIAGFAFGYLYSKIFLKKKHTKKGTSIFLDKKNRPWN